MVDRRDWVRCPALIMRKEYKMVKAIGTIAFFVGFAAFVAYKFIAAHARNGWKSAKDMDKAMVRIHSELS